MSKNHQTLTPSQVEVSVLATDVVNARAEGCATGKRVSRAVKSETKRENRICVAHTTSSSQFFAIFGIGGIAMVFVFLLSAGWTFMLAIIQFDPTGMANRIMNTTNFDDGDFWLLPDPPLDIEVPAIIALLSFSIGYLGLVGSMLFPDSFFGRSGSSPNAGASRTIALPVEKSGSCVDVEDASNDEADRIAAVETNTHQQDRRLSRPVKWRLAWDRVKYEVASPYGLVRQYYNPVLDLPKLIFQTTTLFTYLHEGFPLPIIIIYSCLLLINWMLSSYRYSRQRPDPNLVFARMFYSFDLFFAVFAPLEVLTYSFYSFDLDRDEFATKMEVMDDGSYDKTARLFADPAKMSVFRITFHYLQFTDTASLLIKCALNLLSLIKWIRTIAHLVENHRQKLSASHEVREPRLSLSKKSRRVRFQSIAISGIFFCAGCCVFVESMVAISSTNNVCAAFPNCAVRSYQWNVGSDKCSCIVFVDRSTSLATFAEWTNPVDTTANLAALAASGHLRSVQIINRALPELPIELRGCQHLEQLILIYTKTERFPEWASDFAHLAYLHIEGDLTSRRLQHLPQDMFAHTKHLHFVHLGCLLDLPSVPLFGELHEMRYLVLAMLHSITAIPSVNGLINLKKFNIVDAIQVYSLPSVSELRKLDVISISSRNPVCCNGFLTGTCDLSDFQCLDRSSSGERQVQCTSERIAAEDLAVWTGVDGTVCSSDLTFDLKDVGPSIQSTDVACGGTMYKRCFLNGAEGMCYNARMMVIACAIDISYQSMRRLQIERGVGDPCDPDVEAWLGCV